MSNENVKVFSRLKSFSKDFFTTRNIAVMGFMSALSVVLYIVAKFNLPFFPPWLDMQFSDLPIILTGYIVHPAGAAVVCFARFFIKLPMTSTQGVGELGDLIFGLSFSLPASIIYRLNRTKKSAAIGLIVGAIVALLASVLINVYILIPFFTAVSFDGDLGRIAKILSALYPDITVDNFYYFYIPLGVVPFNALRLGVCAVLTFYVYKALERAINSLFHNLHNARRNAHTEEKPNSENAQADTNKNEQGIIDAEKEV